MNSRNVSIMYETPQVTSLTRKWSTALLALSVVLHCLFVVAMFCPFLVIRISTGTPFTQPGCYCYWKSSLWDLSSISFLLNPWYLFDAGKALGICLIVAGLHLMNFWFYWRNWRHANTIGFYWCILCGALWTMINLLTWDNLFLEFWSVLVLRRDGEAACISTELIWLLEAIVLWAAALSIWRSRDRVQYAPIPTWWNSCVLRIVIKPKWKDCEFRFLDTRREP